MNEQQQRCIGRYNDIWYNNSTTNANVSSQKGGESIGEPSDFVGNPFNLPSPKLDLKKTRNDKF